MKTRLVRLGRVLSLVASAAAAVLLLNACSSHLVRVEALSREDAHEKISYRIRSGIPALAEDSLRYQEAVELIKTALSGRGMYEAPTEEMADIIIDLDYGIGPPKVVALKRQEPTYKTVHGTQGMPSQRIYSGDREYTVNQVAYEKYVRIAARENLRVGNAEQHRAPQVWEVDASTEGASDDLRKHLPILAAATIDYIARDLEGAVTIRLKPDSPDVEFVKRGMKPARPTAELIAREN